MTKRKRPVECRLCQCPVVENSDIRMGLLDAAKLSEWWKKKLDAELDLEDIDQQWICYFCLCDVKLEHQYYYSESNPGKSEIASDWWTGFDTNNFFYENYCQGELIQRCYVAIDVLPSPATARSVPPRVKIVRPRKTMCIHCKIMFPSREKTFLHSAKEHKNAIVFKCYQCNSNFFSKNGLKDHIINAHLIRCVYCSNFFPNHLACKEHVMCMHQNEVQECKRRKCDMSFRTPTAYKEHIASKHDGSYRCIYCTFENNFNLKWSLILHVRARHKDVLIQCSRGNCNAIFKTETELSGHIQAIHTSNANEIECELCNLKLLQPHLNGHMRKHHNRSHNYTVKEETKCYYCHLQFPSRKSAYKHVREDHTNIETFQCGDCRICFETVEMKKDHYQKVHRGHFTCIYCENWECTNRMNLRRHILNKHREQMVQCRYNNKCGLYFKTQDDLQTHIKNSHEGDKSNKLQCVYCSKFLPCNHLGKHIKTFHKAIVIKCNFSKVCRSYFLTKEEREKHIVEVHEMKKHVKTYTCEYCKKIFYDFQGFKMHTQKKHGETHMQCSIRGCTFLSLSSSKLDQHIKEQHAEKEKLKVFMCQKCNFKSGFAHNLKIHNLRKHGTEKLQCPKCSIGKYKSAYALEKHFKAVHFKAPKAICVHCGLPAANLSFHSKQRLCKRCKKLIPCSGLVRDHKCKG